MLHANGTSGWPPPIYPNMELQEEHILGMDIYEEHIFLDG